MPDQAAENTEPCAELGRPGEADLMESSCSIFSAREMARWQALHRPRPDALAIARAWMADRRRAVRAEIRSVRAWRAMIAQGGYAHYPERARIEAEILERARGNLRFALHVYRLYQRKWLAARNAAVALQPAGGS
ncbi:MAG: hypothetical protein ACT4P2_09455 [Pseudomonadota bacterium]